MRVTFQLEGVAEFERNLATLARRVQRKIVKQAVTRALKPVQMAARANARNLRRSGTKRFRGLSSLLAKHIVIKPAQRQPPGTFSAHVMMRPGVPEFFHAAQTVGVSYIPAAIEYGHGADKDRSARPFLRPAADSRQAETLRVLERELRTGLLREAMQGRAR